MKWKYGWLFSVLLLGCPQSSPTSLQGEPPLPPPTCEETQLPEKLELPWGGRWNLRANVASHVLKWTVSSDEPDVILTSLAAKSVRVKVPYRDVKTTLKVQLTCESSEASREILLTTRAPRWEKLHQWTDGASEFPKNREYAARMLVGRKWYLHGGFWYLPTQYTVANDTWVFDLDSDTWSEIPTQPNAPEFAGATFFHVPSEERLHLVGGMTGNVSSGFELPWHAEVLEVSSGNWSTFPVKGKPSTATYQAGIVFDVRRNRFVHFCGTSAEGPNCKVATLQREADGTFVWNAQRIAVGDLPQGREGFAHAYDEENDRIVLYSGRVGAGNDNIGDTWALELSETPMRWVKLLPEEGAMKRRNSAFAYDEANHRLVVWGGTPNGRDTVEGLWFLDLEKGFERWEKVTVPNDVPPRTSGWAVYDSEKKRMVVGMGNSSVGKFADTWAIQF